MTNCCNDKACEIEALRSRQSSALKIVLGINIVMFIVELTAGLMSGSLSLLADSLDMLGDALVYSFSIYVVARDAPMKAVAALLKGGIMATFGVFVLGQAVYKMIFPHIPVFEAIGAIGLLALGANSLCLLLLWRHRADDINMSSVWLCSRNDIIANISVLFAAGGVWLTRSGWPDILVGVALAALFLQSSLSVLRGAMIELRATHA
ncbi:MAG: cation transporter [Candidatus Contendobacter sp.]|nr:cation transporter [Candidatus Contendobacter sp.]